MIQGAVYELDPAEGFQWVVPTEPRRFDELRSLEGRPLRHEWTPLQVDLLIRDEAGRVLAETDMPWLGEHALVLGDRAVEVLGPILAPDVELLPLSIAGRSLWLVHPLRILDALIPAESEIVRFSSGRIMSVEKGVFDGSKLVGVRAFKLRDFTRGPIYLTEGPVEAARTANLTGALFRPHRVTTTASSG